MSPTRFNFSAIRARLHGRSLIALIVLALVVAGLGVYLTHHSALSEAPANALRSVEVKSVAELASEATPLSIVGTVDSTSEATVRAESSGQVTAVYHALGDSVAAGTIVAELEDASQRAALLQAQGALDATKAALSKVQGGTRPEQLSILQSAEQGARSGAVNTLLSAYAAVDNAVHVGADALFTNPESALPTFAVQSSDSQIVVNIQSQRIALNAMLARERSESNTLSISDDLAAELATTQNELRAVRDLLDDMIAALNKAIPTTTTPASTIASYQATTVASRASINSTLVSVASSIQAMQTAESNLELGVNGSQDQDVDASAASVKQAQGAYDAALANVEKAIIRAPISGTINSFSLKRGDYVQQSSPVLTVANNGALEVVAYMTEQDRSDIRAGDKALFDNGAEGVVTRVAPALDPETKKIEVRIGITAGAETLVNGQSVTATFQRHTASATTAVDASNLTIPITAIKVGANSDVSVFTVEDDGTLTAHAVTLGELQGDRVVVASGLTPEMMIVTDARGLRAGQAVLRQ